MEGIEAVLLWELGDAAVAISMIVEPKEHIKGGKGYTKKRLEDERKAFINEAYPTIGPLSALTRRILTGRYTRNGIDGKLYDHADKQMDIWQV